MYAKGSTTPIQTKPVAIRQSGVMVNTMLPVELDVLQEISLDQGSIKFQVTGYAQSLDKQQVTLIMVDGGFLIYGDEGLVSATGMAETILNAVYLPEEEEAYTVSAVDEEGRRLFKHSFNLPLKVETKSGKFNSAGSAWYENL